ncbi:M24 family metallopeptidase [Liquorilactobacillus satsumensis]|uniref:M24 family metallopeptidase n=1 Tax=Liquorilactobacillus satsumensis TaxID=259059 RepID=UPI001E2FBF35|nr:Xaa-Pro peptidase family protein [Liquorilactobacillus satsumensis]MCC7667744.1 proline dipeptidase [Liquorilactobacillus satsumensis]MCP9356925.1 aminopeptidase P family protein [Liquorilactobacillus satsumensis]MCP9370872.1 aminopeptidase P family protein [Liquorilactobacillus satsumensis]
MTVLESEILRRINNVQQKMAASALDAYVITDAEDIWYLTNINYSPEQRPFFFILFQNRKPLFIVPKLEEAHVEVPYFEYEIEPYFDVTARAGENWFEVLAKRLANEKQVGIEDNAQLFITQQVAAPKWSAKSFVKQTREIKSEYELEKIKVTAQLCSDVLNKTLQIAKTGTTIAEVYMLPYQLKGAVIKQNFSITNRITNCVWNADYSFMPHSIPAMDSVIKAGPNIDISIFKLAGYAAECERTFFTEEPSAQEKEHFEQMMAARKVMLQMLRPGVKAAAIEEAVLNSLKADGVAERVLHRPGHGIGLNNHEEPTLSLGNETELKENMVVSVEPGIYFDGQGGYRHSDTVRITKDGYEFYTQAPTELKDLILK